MSIAAGSPMKKFSLLLKNNRIVRLVFKTSWIGIYPTFAKALADIPDHLKTGYDRESTRDVFTNYPIDRVRPADYAIMLHLRNLMKPGGRLVDLGGNIGMMCYTTQKYFALPQSFQWTVCDVPNVLEAGRQVAVREGNKSLPLHFVADLANAGRADIFFSSGTLQYIEAPLAAMLRQLPSLPPAVLINRIPVWEKKAISTIQDIGFCMAAYSVFNRTEFVSSMEALGYQLVDSWPCLESTFSIRFRPKIRLNAYEGFYFKLPDPSDAGLEPA